MSHYLYILEPYKGMKTRYNCPNCNKKTFTRYLNRETQTYLHHTVGFCQRRIKCGYHYAPKSYFTYNTNQNCISSVTLKASRIINNSVTVQASHIPSQVKANLIDEKILDLSLSSSNPNNFLSYLRSLWNKEAVQFVKERYLIGTSSYWKGSTVFWQMDIKNRIRTGKIMLYDKINCKRIKKPYNHINWVHSVLKYPNYNLKQCFFGEHLLNSDKNSIVAIVESEKTAVIASIAIPEFIWLACGSVNNLKKENTMALKDRHVILYPDLNCIDIWEEKAKNFKHFKSCQIESLFEIKASEIEKEKGYDLADYLIEIYKHLK